MLKTTTTAPGITVSAYLETETEPLRHSIHMAMYAYHYVVSLNVTTGDVWGDFDNATTPRTESAVTALGRQINWAVPGLPTVEALNALLAGEEVQTALESALAAATLTREHDAAPLRGSIPAAEHEAVAAAIAAAADGARQVRVVTAQEHFAGADTKNLLAGIGVQIEANTPDTEVEGFESQVAAAFIEPYPEGYGEQLLLRRLEMLPWEVREVERDAVRDDLARTATAIRDDPSEELKELRDQLIRVQHGWISNYKGSKDTIDQIAERGGVRRKHVERVIGHR